MHKEQAPAAREVDRTRTNWWVDLVVLLSFLIATAPRLTGVPIHEWLSAALAATVVVHLLLHWSWIVKLTRRFISGASRRSRLNYTLDWLIFIGFTVIMISGLLISQAILPFFGWPMPHDAYWRWIHDVSTDLTLLLGGLHLALHWDWIVKTTARGLGRLRRATDPWISIQWEEGQ